MFGNQEHDLEVLSMVANKNKLYLENKVDIDAKETIGVAWNIIEVLRDDIPEIKGGFGVGFPFHSLNQFCELITNPEFSRYVDVFIDKIETAKKIGQVAWACLSCQEFESHHPKNCIDCNQTYIKPRDVMKVMPDIDLFLIAENTTPSLLKKVQDTLKENSFHQSDISARETLNRIDVAFDNIENGGDEIKFPGDVHVISIDDYVFAMDKLKDGIVDIDVDIYSLHYQWVLNKDIDLAFDIMFSSTFNDAICEPGIKEASDKAKSGLAKKYSEAAILDIVKQKSRRAEALLSHEPTLAVFLERIHSWGNNDRLAHTY